MPSDLMLIPSYGRDYSNKTEVLIAWTTDKDFTIQDLASPFNGKQISRDVVEIYPELEGTTFHIRYKRRMNIAKIAKVDGVWSLI